jgi:hypothetical protein
MLTKEEIMKNETGAMSFMTSDMKMKPIIGEYPLKDLK